jgi:mono/diheme cytochrome c family protein
VLAIAAVLAGSRRVPRRAFVAASMASVAVAGHLGGELTYGEGYFLAPLRDEAAGTPASPSGGDPGALELARDVLPLFESRCVECHGEKKQKGDLRLDRVEARWFEAGELGALVVRGDPASSELVRRIELPLDDEDHMPPPKKPQLETAEIATIRAWIEQGAR